MRERDLDSLDFAGLCRRLGEFATSVAGRQRCHTLRPADTRAEAEKAVAQTQRLAQIVDRHGQPPLGAFPDIRPHLERATPLGSVLDGPALVEVRSLLEHVRRCAAFFNKHMRDADAADPLLDLVGHLPLLPALEQTLRRSLDEEGGVLDQASDELAAIRAAIRRVRETLSRRLHDLIGKRSMADAVADHYVTLRNDRFVIPIKAAASSKVQGVVQDRSISGETFFVEPLFAVELNNELLSAVREEESIVLRILADLSDLVRRDAQAIERGVEILSDIDCTAARVLFAKQYECTAATFSDGEIELRGARHPGLSFTGRAVTPIDIVLPADKNVLVVTGPNTGGKTVALKTLGLSALMARTGMMIPADEGARLPFFEHVFTDVGDEQNIERNLSTFSAHVVNLREILTSADDSCLILLDEPGVGTDPEEGAALAVGILTHLARCPSKTAVTTHYRAVKLHALSSDACQVAAVDFDVDTLEPHYRLIYHSLGRSLALPIAERLGLDREVLAAARQAQSEDSRKLDDVLHRLEASRTELEHSRENLNAELADLAAQKAEIRNQRRESERLLAELRERRQNAWKDELRDAREFVRSLKEKGRARLREVRSDPSERADFANFVRQQEREIAERSDGDALPGLVSGPAPVTLARPSVGDTVEVGDGGIRGELLSVGNQRAWIQRGTLRFEVSADELRRISGPTSTAPAQVRIDRSLERIEREITLVGLRARQALEKLERFLDRAVQSDQSSVRIVHGIGSGALQRAVREYLSTSPYCSGYRAAEQNEGGAGVTVAVLRED